MKILISKTKNATPHSTSCNYPWMADAEERYLGAGFAYPYSRLHVQGELPGSPQHEGHRYLQGSQGVQRQYHGLCPWANPDIVRHEYGIDVVNDLPEKKYDAAIVAVAHQKFEGLNVLELLNEKYAIFDVKGTLDKSIRRT